MRFALCNGGGGGGGGGSSGGGDGSGGVADGREISWDDPLLKESLIFSTVFSNFGYLQSSNFHD